MSVAVAVADLPVPRIRLAKPKPERRSTLYNGVMKRALTLPAVLLGASLSLAISAAHAQVPPPQPAPPAAPAPPAPPVLPVAQDPQPSPPPFPQPAPPPPFPQPAPAAPFPQPAPAAPFPQAAPQGYPQPAPQPGYPQPAYYPQPVYVPVFVPVAQRPQVSLDAPPDTSLWYGWQTLIAVAPFDITMFAGLSRYGDRGTVAMFTTGFVGRNLAPAVVHLVNRRPGLAFGSIGLHAAATATGVAVGYAIGIAIQGACGPREPCRGGFRDMPPGPEYGAIAGSMVGTVLDVVILARKPKSSWSSTQTGSSVMVVPFATASSGGLAAGGVF